MTSLHAGNATPRRYIKKLLDGKGEGKGAAVND
jgi:hypothetical protein